MNKLTKTVLFVVLLLQVVACDKNEDEGKKTVTEGKRQTLTLSTIDELNKGTSAIDSHADYWRRSSLTLMGGTYVSLTSGVTHTDYPVYPRITKTSGGDYVMFFHEGVKRTDGSMVWAGNECSYLRSSDLVNWSFGQKLYSVYAVTDSSNSSNKRGFAGCNVLTLPDGQLMSVVSYRAITNYRNLSADNGLMVRFSSDDGRSWSEEQMIYQGTNWEPMPVLLPSGRIEVYFTDSNKLITGVWSDVYNDSGTSMIYSDDNGRTWTPSYGQNPLKVIRQVRAVSGATTLFTDQMPAVICLNDGKQKVAALESFIGAPTYKSYISFAYSDSKGDWGTISGTEEGPVDRVNNPFLGCAPYLIQFPSGETVISYNESSIFYMRMGDEKCRNSTDPIRIFDGLGSVGKGFWGSMYVTDPHTMVAAIGGSGNMMQLGRFYLNHAVNASTHSVTVDGNNDDWKSTDEALYVGSIGQTKTTLRVAQDAENIYFLAEIADSDISKDDYVQLFLAPASTTTLDASCIRVKASHGGLKNTGVYAGGWHESETGATVQASYDGTLSYSSDEDNGYLVEVAVPRNKLTIIDGQLLVNFAVFDVKEGEDALIATTEKSTEKWIPILGL